MDQRRLSVGDIVDDYCPRERRITDHAIVAMIDNAIRQTRCTACDSEHPYKEARAPRSRKKTTAPGALYAEVLASATPEPPARLVAERPAEPEPPPPAATAAPPPAPAPDTPAPEEPPAHVIEEGPVHRPLIRATLPRPEGATPPSRPIPEFTVRQPGIRGRFRDDGRFRGGPAGRNGGPHGQGKPGRAAGGHQHGRPRHGRPSPHKKRSR